MKKIFFILTLSLSCNLFYAQGWLALGTGLNSQARVLYADTILNRLFVGGNFWAVNGHSQVGIAAWTGTSWDTSITGLNGYPVLSINEYQNNLYVSGYIEYNGFTKWNGTSWDSIDWAFGNTGAANTLIVYDSLLYCSGNFIDVNGNYSLGIAVWNGNNWIPIGLPHGVSEVEGVCYSIVFQNMIYFASSFYDTLTNTSFSLLTFDGTNWNELGNNLGSFIHSLAVYNNELYIGGGPLANGQFIYKWDGTNFVNVGGGINNEIDNLRVIGNKLYAVGSFTQAGIVSVSNIAVWDGYNWSAFSSDTFNIGIGDIAVFNNELYVTGGFTKINSDTVMYIAKYNGWYLGENTIKKNGGVDIYPNPTNTTLNIHLSSYITNETLLIKDILGNEVYKEILNNSNETIDVSKWSKGMYFYQITNNQEIYNGKFIIE
jgi:hypothetical protein